MGRIESNHKLVGEVNRVGVKAEMNRAQAMPRRERGIGGPRSEVIDRELRLGKEVRPAVEGEGDVTSRRDRDDTAEWFLRETKWM